MNKLLLLSPFLLLGCSSAAESTNNTAFPAEPLSTIESTGAALSIEVRTAPEQPPARGTVTAELTLKDMTGKLRDDLDITVDTFMPAMGHGASVIPTVKSAGGGAYVVSDIDLFMQGGWQLRATIGGPLKDSATIPLQIP